MTIKKNLLDLSYNKYLQYFTTRIILVFTYIIGLLIALFSGQVNYNNLNHLSLMGLFSLLFLIPLVLLAGSYKNHLNNITEEIKELRL